MLPCYLVGHELRQQGAEIPPPLGAKILNPLLQCLAFLFPVAESQLVFNQLQVGLRPFHQQRADAVQIPSLPLAAGS